MGLSESAFLLGESPTEITPEFVDDVILGFQNSLPDTELPEVISVQTRPDAIDGECFNNVRHQIEEFGGAQCFGWRVNLLPSIYIYGEFHAVWRRPDGVLFDVSPVVSDRQRNVVFIRDKRRVYEGRRIAHISAVLWDVFEVHAYLKVLKKVECVDNAIYDAVLQGQNPILLCEQLNELRGELKGAWASLRQAWNSSHKT